MLRNPSHGIVRKAVTEISLYPRPSEKLHGFTLLRSKFIPELELTALQLQHDKTGADYIHIAREDRNNVFSIGFKTNPPDDTGLPHILEHTTLCGSKKYPIRDPFFKMLPRTLSNFMNAMTASNYTYYPFATTNHQDFKNLMSVYFDATLHPLLKLSDFYQEGWRIGPENPSLAKDHTEISCSKNKLVFKGVVYNEMKGQMSDSGYLFYIRFQDHIFPELRNSGGDPQKITNLTHRQLTQFHADHYHPSNAKIFTYGDMSLTDHLKEINSQFSAFEKQKPITDERMPINLSDGPQSFSVEGPVDPLMPSELQFKTSISWVIGNTADVHEIFSLEILAALLLDGYGSPLFQNLIGAGLGTEWSPNTGFDTSAKLGIFSIGLTGVKKPDLANVKEVIFQTLRQVHQKGFDDSKVQGLLHQMEISLKHKTAKFGMSLLNKLQPQWFQDVDPFECLKWNEIISTFKAKYAKGGYLENLLETYLLNDNTLTFTMAPSENYGDSLVQEEAKRLAQKIENISKETGGEEEAKSKIVNMEYELLQEQAKSNTEDLSCLPSVSLNDIPRKKDIIEIKDTQISGTSVQWRLAPTNGLTYFRAINIFENLPTELRSLIPLFTESILRIGTFDMEVGELEDLIKLKTGGLSSSYFNSQSPHDLLSSTEGLAFSGMALDQNVPDMFKLLRKLILETNFDSPKAENQIRQLLQASSDGAVNVIASRGHSYAMSAAERGFGDYFCRKEQVNGLEQLKFTTMLANRPVSEGLMDVIKNLKRIQQLALAGSSFRCAMTCGSESVSKNESELQTFIDSIPRSTQISSKSTPTEEKRDRNIKLFYPLPYQVYYGALSLPTVPYTSPASAPLQVLSQLLTHKFLHHEIREKGGAYGGGASARGLCGVFNFYSYRDPNPVNTLSIFKKAGKVAVEKQWTERDLEDAKLSIFQTIDAPKSVNSEGMTKFLSGVSDKMAQEHREQLLDVTKAQVQEVSQKYIVEGLETSRQGMVFIGEKKPWVDDRWNILDLGITSSPNISFHGLLDLKFRDLRFLHSN
ncbi:Mitochondrial presequence protease [Golovinomyces cichoracearum]|uniref:Presequence protease, mitochondrial n=1 Tax=Golovinomyces cichoracearum TaxID=62708 RepID=A0A420J850_9PEZI|nr:Mitochondrial presequence protease [Golovinomyces cichoracearum]